MRFNSQLITSVALVASASAQGRHPESDSAADQARFLAFIAKQGKSYPSVQDFSARMTNWKATDIFIKNYPPSSFTMAHNQFSDWSKEEK